MAKKTGAGGPEQPSTTEQLRDDIDSGKTGEKVRAPDPAAAPLGTDAEAGGTPPDPEMIRQARDEERRPPLPRGRREESSVWIVIGVLLVGLLSVVLLAIML